MAGAKKKAVTKKMAATPRKRTSKPKLLRTDNLEFNEKGEPTVSPSMTVTVEETGETMMLELAPIAVEIKIRAALDGIFAKAKASKDPFAVLQKIVDGVWEPPKATRERKIPLEVQALVRLYQWDVEETAAKWRGMDAATRKRVRNDPAVSPMLAQLKAEAAQDEGQTSSIADLFQAPPPPPPPAPSGPGEDGFS